MLILPSLDETILKIKWSVILLPWLSFMYWTQQ
jgi:hypothetical protein